VREVWNNANPPSPKSTRLAYLFQDCEKTCLRLCEVVRNASLHQMWPQCTLQHGRDVVRRPQILIGKCSSDIIILSWLFMYVCMYVWGMGHNPVPAPRPTMIYCAFPLINPLLILHFERNAGLCFWLIMICRNKSFEDTRLPSDFNTRKLDWRKYSETSINRQSVLCVQ
jgi:hypothetical protein